MSDIHPFDDPERLRLLLVDVHYGATAHGSTTLTSPN